MRRTLALFLALSADAIQWLITPLFAFAGIGEIFDAAVDTAMAVTLTLLRGFHWSYLPTFVAELIPGVNLVPLWTIAVLLTWKVGPRPVVPVSALDATLPDQSGQPGHFTPSPHEQP